MVKKILFFFLFNSSLVNFFSQNLIIIEGSVLSPEGNSKIFGARIYLTQNGNLITKSISIKMASFLLNPPFLLKVNLICL